MVIMLSIIFFIRTQRDFNGIKFLRSTVVSKNTEGNRSLYLEGRHKNYEHDASGCMKIVRIGEQARCKNN